LEVFLLEAREIGHRMKDASNGGGAELGVNESAELGHEVGEDAYIAGRWTAAEFVETSF
jgi:hypothetical protein